MKQVSKDIRDVFSSIAGNSDMWNYPLYRALGDLRRFRDRLFWALDSRIILDLDSRIILDEEQNNGQ